MADIHIKNHDGVKQVKKQRTLEIPMDILGGSIPFEKVCFRHLSKPLIEKAKPYSKVVLTFGQKGITPEYKRKVLKINGHSTKPYYENRKGDNIGWAEEEI